MSCRRVPVWASTDPPTLQNSPPSPGLGAGGKGRWPGLPGLWLVPEWHTPGMSLKSTTGALKQSRHRPELPEWVQTHPNTPILEYQAQETTTQVLVGALAHFLRAHSWWGWLGQPVVGFQKTGPFPSMSIRGPWPCVPVDAGAVRVVLTGVHVCACVCVHVCVVMQHVPS